MKIIRHITIAAMTLLAAIICLGQDVRITGLDTSSGNLAFALSPVDTASDYACSAEWRSTLSSGSWTGSWYPPFASFAKTNGMFYAALPRFFRISCSAGQTTNTAPTAYSVTGIVPSQINNGVIYWPDTGNTGLIYYVELATAANGPWRSQWTGRTNIHATATTTNSVHVPLFFRVVTITESGELPW